MYRDLSHKIKPSVRRVGGWRSIGFLIDRKYAIERIPVSCMGLIPNRILGKIMASLDPGHKITDAKNMATRLFQGLFRSDDMVSMPSPAAPPKRILYTSNSSFYRIKLAIDKR